MAEYSFSDLQKIMEESGAGQLLPKNTYDVVVESSEYKVANSGADMIKVFFRVTSGEQKDRGGVWNNFVVPTPDSKRGQLFYFFKHMKALGLADEYFKANPSMEQVANDLTGRHCRIEVDDQRVYDGAQQNDVNGVLPPSDPSKGKPINKPKTAGVPDVPSPAARPTSADSSTRPQPEPGPVGTRQGDGPTEATESMEASTEQPEPAKASNAPPAPPF